MPTPRATDIRNLAIFDARNEKPAKAGLELLFQSSLFQDSIGGVPGLDAYIDCEVYFQDRAMPYFMVALALANFGALCRS